MHRETELRAIARDQRGVILVVAIPMALILVGCIWQLAGMTEAVSFRESLEDAADAAAFQGAVLHARGMNAVAALNIVMMLLVAVIASLRSLDSLAIAALAAAGAADPQRTAAVRPDPELGARVEAALAIVSRVQAGIAAEVPLMASVDSALDAGAFYRGRPAGSDALAFSAALLPGAADRELSVDPRRPWLLTADPSASALPRIGGGLSTATAATLTLTLTLTPSLPVERPRAEPCAAEERCSALAQQLAGAGLPEPARVWSRAENGNVMLQIWSIARGSDRGAASLSERALGMLGRGVGEVHLDRHAYAQAEYHFVCPAERPAWAGCADHALWSLGWRARLRRLWSPTAGASARRIERALGPSLAAIEHDVRAQAGPALAARDLLRTFLAEPRLGGGR